MHKYAQELEMFLSIKFSGKILLNKFILLSLFIESTLPTPKYWSERSACDMCRQKQRPLLTLLRLSLSSSPVFTFLPECLCLGLWIYACTLILTHKYMYVLWFHNYFSKGYLFPLKEHSISEDFNKKLRDVLQGQRVSIFLIFHITIKYQYPIILYVLFLYFFLFNIIYLELFITL